MKTIYGTLLSVTILYCIFCGIGSDAKVSEELKVVLSHGGGVIGKYMTSQRGRGIRAFLGVPFAEPPIGDLRFANPQPKAPWTDFIETTVDNKMCPQAASPYDKGLNKTEDCLYLNVHTPAVS